MTLRFSALQVTPDARCGFFHVNLAPEHLRFAVG
ncbi:hypothetical protein THITH_16580 [Thioalkalivibrio paradoxus ARh 1]|uniref:Uncharacterized protein n=1 Tax=Thioalkalivibrio paradoxus ARh 1 TaxID=713585 RepID=W0DTV5_9GAMM|nr:hypothetical protein THITH_16580 [Thioalkalivibrio paradoxus ARh 1]